MKDMRKQDLPEIIFVMNIMYNMTSIATATKVIRKQRVRKDICSVLTQCLQRKTNTDVSHSMMTNKVAINNGVLKLNLQVQKMFLYNKMSQELSTFILKLTPSLWLLKELKSQHNA
jgi:hypothetical protein